MKDKYIIFGAGKYGREALKHIAVEKVQYYCDNNSQVVGTYIEGIEVISFEKLLEIHQNYIIILAVAFKHYLRKQFEQNGIKNYIEYLCEEDICAASKNSVEKELYQKSDMNSLLDKYVEACKKINCLQDYIGFKNLVVKCKQELHGEQAFYASRYGESMLYGHGKALMKYAGIEEDYINFPIVEHGACFCGTHPEPYHAAIVCGNYDKEKHLEKYPYVPIFSVGPYIHYADIIYNEEELREYKKKNGKTALIFLGHSAEKNKVSFDERNIEKIILEKYKRQYDTVMVCAYWCDVDQEIYQHLYENGIKVVSAGFRFDVAFINRLKTIIALADEVFAYGVVSAIPYAMYMKKKVFVYNLEEKYSNENVESFVKGVTHIEDTDIYQEMVRILYTRYGDVQQKLTEEDRKLLNLCYGFEQVKTPEEIRTIYEVCKDIWKNCDNKELLYPQGVYKTYLEYQCKYDYEKLYVLTQALGKGFWNQ